MDTEQLTDVVAALQITIKATQIASRAGASDWAKDARHWRVTLTYQGRRMRTTFSQGSAHTAPPSAADVLYCLCSDASSVESAGSFESWCGDLGYDTDSRKAHATYTACARTLPRLRAFLGSEFERVCAAEH